MLKNYFTIGWRNLLRTKSFSIINICGLATGMAVAMLIGLWVMDELNFDRTFQNYDRIAQVYHHLDFGGKIITVPDSPEPMAAEIKNSIAEVEETVVTTWPREQIFRYEQKILSENALFVEPQFATVFSITMIDGTSAALKDLHSVLLSKTFAAALLGDNAVGKMITFGNRDQLLVAGVYEDFPANSTFATVDAILPLAYYFSMGDSHRKQLNNWEDFSFQCLVLLKDKNLRGVAEAKMKNMLFQKASGDGQALKPQGMLFPMEQWHLYDHFENGVSTGGQIRFVRMFGVIGVFVLLLACINFMNLSTARSEKRSKEVGVRKVMGSVRKQLVGQFLSESLLVVMVAFVLAAGLAALALPWFNMLADKKIVMPWTDANVIWMAAGFIVITSLLAGSYPAWYLSSFSPVQVLKGPFRAGRLAVLPRKLMVVFQFAVSIVLIIGTVVVFLQIQYAKDRPIGFAREGTIHIAIRTDELGKANYNSLRNDLLSTGAVANMAMSDHPITGSMSADASLTWEGKDPAFKPLIAFNSCSHDFPGTNGFEFLKGRDFSRDYASDSLAVIVNEKAANLIGDGNVLGKRITFGDGRQREIVGVIKDQIRWTPFEDQSPHIYYVNYDIRGYITIRLQSKQGVRQALQKVEAVIKKYDAGAPFEYKFVDEDYARLFSNQERLGKLATIFSTLAVFISCIGIFGLAAFAASQRIKEIGIRKVLGASVLNLWKILSMDFLLLVTIAIVVAMPLAYYVANEWLQQYDYRIAIPWWVFAGAGILAIVITLLTVSYQAIKAALVNPVSSLKVD